METQPNFDCGGLIALRFIETFRGQGDKPQMNSVKAKTANKQSWGDSKTARNLRQPKLEDRNERVWFSAATLRRAGAGAAAILLCRDGADKSN